MREKTVVDLLNLTSSLLRLGPASPDEQADWQMFELQNEDPLTLPATNQRHFYKSIQALMQRWGVERTLSQEVFLANLIPRIRAKKKREELFTPADKVEFQKLITGLPLEEYRMVRPILGVSMTPEDAPVRFGDFKIGFGDQYLLWLRDNPPFSLSLEPAAKDQLFIECKVLANDPEAAEKLADSLFYRFELGFRVLIGRRADWVEVGIENHHGAQMRDFFVFSRDGRPVRRGSSWKGAMQPYLLNNERFPMPNAALTRMFALITRPNSELEEHIIRCAEWTGQAIAEPNEAAALVKAAIALEVLFSSNEKGPFAPSITSQIAECCAFLLGDEAKSPEDVEREVKRLYGVRSAVVHSGKDFVDSNDLDILISICRKVLLVLLGDEPFAEMDTMAKLAAYFKDRKYRGFKTARV